MRTHTRTRVHTRSQADVTTHPPRATATSAGTVGVRRQQGCGLAQHTGVLRATTVAVAERSLRGTRHPGHPMLPETRAAPWDSWECWPCICPQGAGWSCLQDHLRARPQTTGGVRSGGAGGPSGAVTVISPASSLGASRTPSLNATGSCVCRPSFLCHEVTVDPPGKTPACLTPFHTRLKCAAVPQAAVPP